jgi:X-Pro dipeptidyl-peptidase
MTGTSYDGTLCLAAATTGVEGLEVIIPVAPVSSFYHYYRSNGLVRSPGGYLGEDADVLYDMINSGDKQKRKANNRRVRDSILVPGQDRITGDFNDFWAQRDYVSQIGNMRAAMLMAHGFNDWNVMPEHSFRFYAAAKAMGLPTQLYYHQWGHGGDPPLSQMNRWFTRYLHGVENGIENDPPVGIVREGKSKPSYYSQYPDSAAAIVKLYCAPGANQQGRLVLTPPTSVTTMTFTDDYRRSMPELLSEKYAAHRLLFVTEPLKQDMRLSGVPKIKVRLAANKAAANFSAYLVLLPLSEGKGLPDHENLVTRGWADPQNHRNLRNQTPLVPGQFVDLRFELMPDDQVIPAGRQIGLLLFSSDKEFTLHPSPGTMLSIDPAGCELVLPVVGGQAKWVTSF